MVSPFKSSIDTLAAIASLPGKNGILDLKKDIFEKPKGIATYFDTLHQKQLWLVHQTMDKGFISISEAAFVPLMAREEFRQDLIDILLAAIFCLGCIGIFIVFRPAWQHAHASLFSSLWAVLLATLAFLILYIYAKNENVAHLLTNDRRITSISSHAEAMHFSQIYSIQSKQLKKEEPHFIHTGIVINSLSIVEERMLIEGMIWQRNSRNTTEPISFSNTANQTFKKIHEQTQGNERVSVWHFSASILTYLDFLRDPFDNQLLTLNLLNTNLNKNIVFLPDFESYDTVNDLVGLSSEITLPAWKMINTFYFYKTSKDQSNLGIKNNIRKERFPDLSFVISIERRFLSAIITTTLPIMIIAIITFLVLLQTSRVKRDAASFAKIIPQLAAIFFSTVLSHQSFMRNFTTTSEILYAEYYYFILYLLLIMVAINTVIYLSTSSRTNVIGYQGNVIVQLFYWPSIAAGILCRDAVIFLLTPQ